MNLITPQQFNQICEWAEAQQANILREGTSLSESQIIDAKLIPVSAPEQVRLLKVDQIPWPNDGVLLSIGYKKGLISDSTVGLTLGYGIFVMSSCWDDRHLIVHDLVHVAQYEKLGVIVQFLEKYLSELLCVNYDNAPMEEEAEKITKRICGE